MNNILTTDRVTGLDDYSDLDSIIQELEVQYCADKPNPRQACRPEYVWSGYGTGARSNNRPMDIPGRRQILPSWPLRKTLRGTSHGDGQLEAAFKQIELLMEQLYIWSETSAAAFGQLKAGLAESGTALPRLMIAPLAKVNASVRV